MPPETLSALSLGFVARTQGSWGDEALATFRESLRQRHGLRPPRSELEATLDDALAQYREGSARLFLCDGRPCRARRRFDPSVGAVPLTETSCQGPCKQAPLVTLRVGARAEVFGQVAQPEDWQRVSAFAKRAAAAKTLLVPPGDEQAHRFDPTHDSTARSLPLRSLEFLVGTFEGDGVLENGRETFHKECVGNWEVGGRYIAIRMAVTYPLPDGRKDVHTALALIGTDPRTQHLEGSVFTDGDEVHSYALEMSGGSLVFQDRADRLHDVAARAARKIFRPLADGYEERLEVDLGGGFEPYYRLQMSRVAA